LVRRGFILRAVGFLAAALVVAALWRVYSWWTSPDLLPSNDAIGLGMGARPVSQAEWTFGVSIPEDVGQGEVTTLTFRSAPTADLDVNTARADVVFSICTRDPGPKGTFLGGANGTGSHYCNTLTPITSATTLQWPTMSAYIVATLTPHQAGRVHIVGANLDYALPRGHWWRHGTQHLPMDVRQKVSPDPR